MSNNKNILIHPFQKNDWNRSKQFRRRCKKCGVRVSLYIFYRNGNLYVKCPKCFTETLWTGKRK